MCHHDAIEKREDSVRSAAQLLGRSRRSLEVLETLNFPNIDVDDNAEPLGGNSETKKIAWIAWIAWDKVFGLRDQGGLHIGSLKVFNQAMLTKWWWCILWEENALCGKVIVSIHGNCGGFNTKSHTPYKSGPRCSGFDLKGYSDSDNTCFNMDRKITSGSYQMLGGNLVFWSAKKQQSVAMPSVEAEYVVGVGCSRNFKSPSPSPKRRKKKKKKITQTRANPKPKPQGPESSRGTTSTKKTSLKQATLKLTKKKASTGGTEKSHLVSMDQPTKARDLERNSYKALSPNQLSVEKAKQPSPIDLPGSNSKNQADITQFAGYAELVPKQNISPDHSVVSSNDQVNKTQSTVFEELVSNQNKGKTYEVEPDSKPPIISTFGQFEALMEDSKEEVMEFRNEEILVAGDDMDANTPKETKESS
ncbi:retrovirus-related pol polyprotein from transposon TNT 1-94 [Tanacetum coccineum]